MLVRWGRRAMTTEVVPVAVRVAVSRADAFEAEAADAASDAALARGAALLAAGELVAFPTETVYGLGANALSSAACARIFAAKGRPRDNPLIVHVATLDMLHRIAHVSDVAHALIVRFWPGPLTLLLPVRADAGVAPEATCGLPTVGVRMPAHPVARLLLARANVPVAAPSANRSGRPSPTTAAHVLADLAGRVSLIVDGGAAAVGVESTVLDIQASPPALLRPGGVTYEQLAPLLPGLRVYRRDYVDSALEAAPTTPGMKYRHYAPDARVVLFEAAALAPGAATAAAGSDQVRAAIEAELAALRAAGVACAVVRTRRGTPPYGGLDPYHPDVLATAPRPLALDYALGSETDSVDGHSAAVAHGLFAALRALDAAGVQVLLVEGIDEGHAGLAVMNRLRKAAAEVRIV
jgi:L-threonylcarbamoyladenylate synthase